MTQTLYDAYGNYYDNYNNVGVTLTSGLGVSKTRVGEGPGFVLAFNVASPYETNFVNSGLYDLPYWFFDAVGDAPEGDNYFPESYLFGEPSTWRTLNCIRASLRILFKVTLDGSPLSGVAFGGAETDTNGEVFLSTGNPYSATWTPVKAGYTFVPTSVTYSGLTKPAIDTFAATLALPTKATTPAPSNAATNVTLDQATIAWVDGGGADTFDVYYGTSSGNLTKVSGTQAGTSFTVTGITNGSPYAYLSTRYWRIDSTNAGGTTTGDEWSFTTIRLSAPGVTYFYPTTGQHYRLLIQSDGSYGDIPGVGVENTDYVFLAAGYVPNFISTTRKLVGMANSKVWVEDI